ncbi:hypothetical protein PR048_011538, partial [Dryococelus australis]
MIRLLKQKQAIILSSSEIKLPLELSQSQWELMMNVINMNIFDHATLAVSSSSVTASEIIPIVNSIKRELEKVVAETSVVKAIMTFSHLSNDAEENQLYIMTTILDPRLKTPVISSNEYVTNARRKLKNAAELHEKASSPHTLSETASSGLSAAGEFSAYLAEPFCPPNTDVNQYWKNRTNFPQLRHLHEKNFLYPLPLYIQKGWCFFFFFSIARLVVDQKLSRLDPDK